jgi:hypothetical protein
MMASQNRSIRTERLTPTGLLHTIAMALLAFNLFSSDSIAATKNGFPLDDALIPANEIRSGGPGKDGIPALIDPEFVAADDASFLSGKDRVLGISHNGVVRAYPIKILNYHEIVNDLFGDDAVVVTFCPLCGSGMAFSSNIRDARLLFGVSGLLYNSDVLMYDLQTQSLWSQLMSQAISGPLKGQRLSILPISHTSWREWKARYPETEVLSTKTGFRRNYRADPYPNYGRSGKIYFPVNQSSKLYKRKMLVMGLEFDGQFKVYPFEELENGQARFADEFQGISFEVLFDEKNKTARVLGADGLEIPTTIAFWFAWYAFHPESEVFTADSKK